ncbi:Tn3 family transposase [Escherichia coli]|nr:Tn3 family transposase [Escherichia coli]MDT8523374.1 Tn3 family transposase [Escherichia coli]
MIQASESEAPYVLDGLLHNESSVVIHEHATDTAGATETTFSMFHSFVTDSYPVFATSAVAGCTLFPLRGI